MVNTGFSEVRKIEKGRRTLPLVSTISVGVLILILVWFARGGSFRLYASLFFGLYSLTGLAWLSIILVSVIQNVAFLPLRMLYERFHFDIKAFEDEIAKTKTEEQYILMNKRVRQGDKSVLFYIINFLFLFIAFISAGRVFLLEFYRTPIDSWYLYNFVPYPEYPLQGVIFHFPFIRVLATKAVGWETLAYIWGGFFLALAILKLFWRIVKPILWRNEKVLGMRIGYNKFLAVGGGLVGTVMILSTIFLRHVPTQWQFYYLSADLSVQNTAFNLITAICTFLAAIYSGVRHTQEDGEEARHKGIPEEIIARVNKAYMRNSFRNGILLGVSAFWVTRLMPCSHDLSVLAFEACYVLSPVTFDLVLPKRKRPEP